MRYGITIPPFGDCFDPRLLARLAQEAEEADWDGFFIWDHLLFGPVPDAGTAVRSKAHALPACGNQFERMGGKCVSSTH